MAKRKSKSALRTIGKRAREEMTIEDRSIASLVICHSLVNQPFFRRARRISTYLPSRHEVNTWPLVERAWRVKQRVFVPVVRKNRNLEFCELGPNAELRSNRFGVLEPVNGASIDARHLDLVITPLVAFDDRCNRIGMGGGYYDRSFSFLRTRSSFRRPKLIGVAFDCQRVERVPASPWDIPLFQVFTESGAVT